eukprot:g1113.t1
MSITNDTDARLARLREKSRLLSSSMKDHEERLNRISNSLAVSYSSAQFTKSNRESNAFRTTLGKSLNTRSSPALEKVSPMQYQEKYVPQQVGHNFYNSRNSPLTTAALQSYDSRLPTSYGQEQDNSPEKAVMDAAKDYVNAMTNRNNEIEELRRVITVKTVKLRLAEEEVERLKQAEEKVRMSNLELTGVVEKIKERADIQEAAKEDLASRILALENTLELQKKANQQLQNEFTNEVVKRESAIKKQRDAENEVKRMQALMEQANSQENNAKTDLRTERMEFIESQKLLRKETITLTQEITTLAANNSELRSKVAELERATNGTMSENKQIKMVHKATVQQLLATREELRDEQTRRRKCESDLARYRGVLKIQMKKRLENGEDIG